MSLSAENTQRKLLWFGWLGFRPKWLQFLNTSKWFLFFICMYFFTQSIVVNGVYSVSITTIEKRFGYSSSMTGFLTSCYDIAALLLTPLISYLGATRRKPKWCGVGLLVMGTGFFIFILPHLFSGKYTVGQASSEKPILCDLNSTISSTSPECKESRSSVAYYVLFIIGMLVTGAGSTPMWNLGTAFIDENVKAKSSPMYIGIFSSSGVIGAGVGFILGGLFLSMYVDIGTQTSLTPKNEEWVGAWWLGFIVGSVLAVLWSGWLIGFPKELPTTQELRKQNLIGNKHSSIRDQEAGYFKLKDLPKASKSLLSKIPYVAVTLGICIDGFLVSAWTAFMPKVIQQQFQYSPSTVSLLMGVVVIPAALLGNFIGAYICKRLSLHLRGAAKMAYMVSALSLVAACLLFLNCDTPSIAGINGSYTNGSSSQLTSSCNTGCACSLDFKPVCSGGVTYFSPCYAGCQTGFKNGSLSDCACLPRGTDVTIGTCKADCGLKPLFYLIAYFLVVFLTFMSATPATVVTLRCVANNQGAFALGIQSSLLRILGTIPGPIVLGNLIDMTCTLWNEGCNGKENCLQYDNRSLSTVVLVTGIISKTIITSCYFITCIFSPKDQAVHNGDDSKRKEITVNGESLRECDRETDL